MQDCILRGTLSHQQMALSVFDPLLSDFDAVILLRRESMPHAELALQNPTMPGQRKARQLPLLLAPAGFASSEEERIVPPKSARALLRNIPQRKILLSTLSLVGCKSKLSKLCCHNAVK